ncbi:uncharacterized protein TTMY_1164 [Thermus thermophilus]|uniref:hypothetical protein n=1 Tax=Thermus thermophilus TaxID=274 RepID=UPI000909CB29|nr:hypothetical protein [Thermus thermophilus]BAW01561.1 uncharacterized protein TTMY_1164 [Thermus thermophilus]BDB12186.1 hypothetical protein TthTMY_19250 [Thermus thermophilus]
MGKRLSALVYGFPDHVLRGKPTHLLKGHGEGVRRFGFWGHLEGRLLGDLRRRARLLDPDRPPCPARARRGLLSPKPVSPGF